MKPEHWQQIETIFHRAMEREPGQRAAFLDNACADDEKLRQRIEALIIAHEQANGFIERPAFEIEAQALANEQAKPQDDSIVGQVIGHYRIIELIGRGGMGEVYLAQDMTLGRQVALKLLPRYFTEDAERVRRFEQEARSVSALNHPNIITIHEIGHIDSTHYIATEFIDGVTLREQMAGEAMNIGDALDVAAQVASALAAAHAKGIIHRDIKPENIIVRRSGYLAQRENQVKVLDFGIAKLTEPDVLDTQMPTRPLVSTDQGITLGTAPYMSPEQAQGLKVDARTDIWSLGIVIYEMVTGRAPFEGPTRSHVIVSILEKEAPPLRAKAGEVPEALEWIVTKALRKDREERYQTAKELLSDLKELKQRLDFEAQVERSLPLDSNSKAISTSTEQSRLVTADVPAVPMREAGAGRQRLSIRYLLRSAKRNKRGLMLALSALVITIAAIVIGLKYFGRNPLTNKPAAPFAKFKVTRLTSSGKASSAVISPDGKYVVHAMGSAEQQSLWLRHIATGSDKEIVPANGSGIDNLSFSPDGNHIYFVRRESGEIVLSEVPVLGGSKKILVRDIDTAVTFSPDGKRFAFVRGDPTRNEASLIVANADGTGEQKLVTHHENDFFSPTASTPAWSPDGERIAFGLKSSGADGRYHNVWAVQVKDRVEQHLTSQQWAFVEAICWLPDGSGLVITAIEQVQGNAQIWYAPYPGGDVRRITNDLNNYQNVSLTTDGGSLVTVLSEGTSNVWVAPVGDASRASQITSNRFDGVGGIAWTPDGRIVHVSRASGNADIWIMNADGTEDRQLTSNTGLNFLPTVSPDGRYIVFMSGRTGSRTYIERMDIDGNNPKELPNEIDGWNPLCTNDSQSVIFTSGAAGKPTLWKMLIDGGKPVQLTDYYSIGLDISPKDGRIAYLFIDEQARPQRSRIGVIASDGGSTTAVFDFPEFFGTIGPGFYQQKIRWTVDGRALTYIDTQGGVSNIWIQPLDGGPRKQLTDFKSDLIFYYDWSPDGKKLALARGSKTSDVVLIRDITNVP